MKMAYLLIGALGMAGLASSTQQPIQRINPSGMTQPTAYHHLVRSGNLLFIAGQVALDGSGNVVGQGDMPAQVQQVLENLQKVLASQNADFGNLVKINIFTTDIEAFRAASDVRQVYFAEHPPASTLVEVRKLARPEFLVEIEAIAVLDASS